MTSEENKPSMKDDLLLSFTCVFTAMFTLLIVFLAVFLNSP